MTDLSYMDPQIEVAANSPRIEMIMQRLKVAGMRPVRAVAPVSFDTSAPLLLDLQTIKRDTIERCARACMMGLPRPLILLDSRQTGLKLSDAIVIESDRELDSLPNQLEAISRRAARTAEVSIRRETARELGAILPGVDPDDAPELLYVGNGSPLFLLLRGILKARGISVTAALSQRTAEDHIGNKRFSAALVDLSPDAPNPHAFISWLKTAGDLTCLPVIGVADSGIEVADMAAETLSAATDIVHVKPDIDAAADKIENLARRYLADLPPVPLASLSSRIADLGTGLFSRSFIEAHLERQMKVAEVRGEPICVLTLKLTTDGASATLALTRALGEALRPLLRDTDCAASYGAGTIAISLPVTPYRGGVSLAERITQKAMRAPGLRGHTLSWRVVERRAYHTAKTLLGAGLSGPYSKVMAA